MLLQYSAYLFIGVCLLELLSGRRPTEDLLELFDTDAVHAALDPVVEDWDLDNVVVVVQMAFRCQESLTSKRTTIQELLPRLEALEAGHARPTTEHKAVTTSNVAKYTVGQLVKRGTIVSITPDTPGATSGPGQLEVSP
jgi:hypothetical protein